MTKIDIYTTMFCGFCYRAKALLENKGAPYNEIDVSTDPVGRKAMTERAGGPCTVPQIFIGERYVGGCEELYALDQAGELDPLLLQ